MTEETIRLLTNAALDFVIILLIGYVLPKLRVFLKVYVIDKLVRAAEQKIQGSGMGTAKKVQVMEWLEALHIKVDDFVDSLIEAAVYELKEEQNKLK